MIKDTAKGYSIWLIPEPKVLKTLQFTIDELSSRFSGPVFSPHITLIGEVELDQERINQKFLQLSARAKTQDLKTTGIAYHNVFFRSMVYELQWSNSLMNMHARAITLFDQDSGAVFYPHLSLLYSSASESVKRLAVQELKLPSKIALRITELQLIETEGQPGDWRIMHRVEL